jgi:hypothetical protein
LVERGTPIATQPSTSTLRMGRNPEKAPIRRDKTQIRNQRKALSALIEIRGNPLLSIIRKKFGL